jgi:hypothetical protein
MSEQCRPIDRQKDPAAGTAAGLEVDPDGSPGSGINLSGLEPLAELHAEELRTDRKGT